jgi:ABC-type protease/lipase transport system fused ATPase/permease subunit
MDEPNSNLDEPGENALIESIKALKANDCTVIITTHRPRLVSIVDYMLVLRSGKQIAFGSAKDMLEAVRKLQLVQTDSGQGQDPRDGSDGEIPPTPAAPAVVVAGVKE